MNEIQENNLNGVTNGKPLALIYHEGHVCEYLNPLRAIFFKENINIYLHCMSLLHINKTQVVEIPPQVRQGPAYST